MEHRTLKFERDDARRWTFKLLDEENLPVLVSVKSYDCLDDAVEDIRDLSRMAEDVKGSGATRTPEDRGV